MLVFDIPEAPIIWDFEVFGFRKLSKAMTEAKSNISLTGFHGKVMENLKKKSLRRAAPTFHFVEVQVVYVFLVVIAIGV